MINSIFANTVRAPINQYSKSSKRALIPCSPNTFRRLQDPNATIIFTTTETGNLKAAFDFNASTKDNQSQWTVRFSGKVIENV